MTGKYVRGGIQQARMQVNVRLRAPIYDRMVLYAKDKDLSQSALVETALEDLFKKSGRKEKGKDETEGVP